MLRHMRRDGVSVWLGRRGLVLALLASGACRQATGDGARASTAGLVTCAQGTRLASLTWKNGQGAVSNWVLTQPIDLTALPAATGCQNATLGNMSVWQLATA